MSSEGTTERVLRLLGLLQRRPSWTATELAAELSVTDRSVRRDVERLRVLGYPVHAVPGVGGGYRLGAGQRLPPLLLDDDEATATAVALRLAAGGTVAGIGDAALRAMAKFDQVMPSRLRGDVRAIHDATETLAGSGDINVETLSTLARACRDRVRIGFCYTTFGGEVQQRRAEPVRMVAAGQRWYLMAYDLDREDWRTFRLDRMRELATTTFRFVPREHPDPVQYVQRSITSSPYKFLARVRVRAPLDEIRRKVPSQVAVVEGDRDGWCLLTTGADDLNWLALHIAQLDVETHVLEPRELRAAAFDLAGRLSQMAGPDLGVSSDQ